MMSAFAPLAGDPMPTLRWICIPILSCMTATAIAAEPPAAAPAAGRIWR
ncbi:MAG TPA: cytochrome C55X NirC, partial [Cupriavidus sp.]|nr:cytochrome C55X NirC [Cupriavidus sp.]